MKQADIFCGTHQHALYPLVSDRLSSRCKMLYRALPAPAAVLRQVRQAAGQSLNLRQHVLLALQTFLSAMQAAGTGIEWSQTVDSVSLSVKLPPATPRSSLTVKLHPQVISINVAGEEVLGGNLPGPIVVQGALRISRAAAFRCLTANWRHPWQGLICIWQPCRPASACCCCIWTHKQQQWIPQHLPG